MRIIRWASLITQLREYTSENTSKDISRDTSEDTSRDTSEDASRDISEDTSIDTRRRSWSYILKTLMITSRSVAAGSATVDAIGSVSGTCIMRKKERSRNTWWCCLRRLTQVREKNRKVVEHSFVLKDNKISYKVPYNTPLSYWQRIDEQLQELIKQGRIRHSNSEFQALITAVTKKDEDTRICIDYRELSSITVKEPFPLPKIDQLLSQVEKIILFQ